MSCRDEADSDEEFEAEWDSDFNNEHKFRVLLCHSVVKGRLDRVRRLLHNGVNPNSIMTSKVCKTLNRRALHLAAVSIRATEDMFALLCDAGASVNSEDTLGWTPAMLAFLYCRGNIVEFLRSRGADVSFIPEVIGEPLTASECLRAAVIRGDAHSARKILESAEKESGRSLRVLLRARDAQNRTALWLAAWRGERDMLDLLLDYHIHHDCSKIETKGQTDEHNFTPLTWAVRHGDCAMVKRFREAGLSTAGLLSDGTSLLDSAVSINSPAMIQTLHELGIVDGPGFERRTALHDAALSYLIGPLVALLKAGSNVNARTMYGATALCGACDRGNWKGAKLLIEAGADVNLGISSVPGESRFTPLMQSVLRHKRRCLRELLLSNTLNINFAGGDEGLTALHYCALTNDVWSARVLLKAGGKKWCKGTRENLDPEALARHYSFDELADSIRKFQPTLLDLCLQAVRRLLPSPLSFATVRTLGLPTVLGELILFLR